LQKQTNRIVAYATICKNKNNYKNNNSCGVIVTRPSLGWETPGANPGKSVELVETNIHYIYHIYHLKSINNKQNRAISRYSM
jgi:hypothetical protein